MGRVYGKGTVYQRASDRRWIAAVEYPRSPKQPRRRMTRSARTEPDARQLLAEMREVIPPRDFLGRAAYMEAARAVATHTEAEWWSLVRSVDSLCAYCGTRTTVYDLETDHIVPVSRGGSDGIDNIAVCCRGCNAEKGTMTGDEYRAWKAAAA